MNEKISMLESSELMHRVSVGENLWKEAKNTDSEFMFNLFRDYHAKYNDPFWNGANQTEYKPIDPETDCKEIRIDEVFYNEDEIDSESDVFSLKMSKNGLKIIGFIKVYKILKHNEEKHIYKYEIELRRYEKDKNLEYTKEVESIIRK